MVYQQFIKHGVRINQISTHSEKGWTPLTQSDLTLQTGWTKQWRESKNSKGGKISAEKKLNQIRTKSVSQELFVSGNYFSPRQIVVFRYWWEVIVNSGGRELQSELREILSHCLSMSQTQNVLSAWQSGLLIICLSWLPSEEKMQRCSLTLKGQWSQDQLISTGKKITLTPSHFLSSCLPLYLVEGRLRGGFISVFCSEKWKFESERWSKASKGTCNWADLDMLSGNMKQQQLWRRVIASLGLYNALSSL